MMGETLSRDVGPVRPGEELPWASLEGYLRAELGGLPDGFEVQQFLGGAANLTYLLRFGEQALVLRRPPFGRIAPGGHDMRREYHALSQLWTVFPKAPRAFLHCSDPKIVGADFVIMEFRDGVVVRGAIPQALAGHDDVGRRIGFAVVDALAELHSVDPRQSGLQDLGRPTGFVERQLAGWGRRWAAVEPVDGVVAMDEVAARLARNQPRPQRASILHNDMKLDNCQFDPGNPDTVRSVFDWDMATLGDPLVDVGTLLNYWPDPSDTPEIRATRHPGLEAIGLPTRSEVATRYAGACDIDLSDLQWYEAFGTWKTAIICQQLYDRYRRGETTDIRQATRGDHVPAMARRALQLLDEGGHA